MLLPIILIIIVCITFYLQLKNGKKLELPDIILITIGSISLIVVAVNYMKIMNSEKFEGFSNNINHKKKHKTDSPYNNSLIRTMNYELKKQVKMNEEDDTLYLDDVNPLKDNKAKFNISNFSDIQEDNKLLNKKHANEIDNLLKNGGIKLNGKDNFEDTETINNNEDIKSIFLPQIVMGGDDGNDNDNNKNSYKASKTLSWDSVFKRSGDSMLFNNTMKPVSNLWQDDNSMFDQQSNSYENSWTKSMNAYNYGSGNPNQYLKPSDWANNPQGSPTADGKTRSNFEDVKSNKKDSKDSKDSKSNTSNTNNEQKLCGVYDDLNLATDQSGNILIGNYTLAKKYFPGYTYIPPVYWDVPQRHTPVCAPPDLNVRKLTGLMDRGTPINALELNPDGSISSTEDTVSLTNVGSLMPKFNYFETPFSMPYV